MPLRLDIGIAAKGESMNTAQNRLSSADRVSKGVLKTLDAKFATLPNPADISHKSAGQLMAQVLFNGDNAAFDASDVVGNVKRLRGEITAKMSAATDDVQAAFDRADAIEQAADFLEGKSALPRGLGDAMQASLLQIRSAREVAPDAAPMVESNLRQCSRVIRERAKHLVDVLERRKAALDLAVSRQGRIYAERSAKALPAQAGRLHVYSKRLAVAEQRAAARHNSARSKGRGQ